MSRGESGGHAWLRRAGSPLVVAAVLSLLLVAGVATAVTQPAPGHGVISTSATQAASAVNVTAPVTKGRRAAAKPAKTAAVPAVAASTTTTVPTAAVAPAGVVRMPSALITLPAPVTAAQLGAVKALRGVDAVEVVDVGTVVVQGAPANTLGVDPSTFRAFTPGVTGTADRLWQYISAGTLASSFEMSRDRNLALGVSVSVTAAGGGASTQQWLGAFMSIGLPGIDLVVSHRLSGPLGLIPGGGLIVSAPTADPYALQISVKATLAAASVVLMRPGLAIGSGTVGGAGVSPAQLSTALTAAVSRVGKPYVWGGTGPNGFDCSGLVGWSFAAAGVNLPRTAAEQALAGPAVPLNRIQPGDLLFWSFDPADPRFIDHVAIYLGNGQMIEAPQSGFLVHVIPVPTGHLVGAVRINPTLAARLGSPWGR